MLDIVGTRIDRASGADAPPVLLLHGVTRDADDLVEVGELERLADAVPGFTYTTVVADEASSQSREGFATDHRTAGQLNGSAIDAYLCGPPPMVVAVRARLKAQGIEPATLHPEKIAFNGTAGPAKVEAGIRHSPSPALRCCRAALLAMRIRGVIVNASSIAPASGRAPGGSPGRNPGSRSSKSRTARSSVRSSPSCRPSRSRTLP